MTNIISLIPVIRETVALLLYKVQAAMALNKVSNVFEINVLKNINIYGDDILINVINALISHIY